MEQFIVSARKYRPQTFNDVVGQQTITSTLLNAIENNHLAQALLFTGPRGVGKTTCARILARKINQIGYDDPNEDFSFNVFELDAASNNSVEDIRNLIDQVRIPPQTGIYKVYIIDEVHMLSNSAFNAFLKTLEEPPKHAIFILATTEKHKIIPTILSRCQIFDFKRITVNDAKEYLKQVASSQNITFEEDALQIIAQKADGAMRDALSIFDRVVSFCGSNLTRQAVAENLNVLDYDYYLKVTNFILTSDIPNLLLMFDTVLTKGFDAHHFVSGLASHFRNLLVCKNPQTLNLLDVSDENKNLFLQQAEKFNQQLLIEAINIANNCDLKYKVTTNQRLLVELCLMQLATLTHPEKKKFNSQLIPAAFFKNVNAKNIAEQISNIDVVVNKPITTSPVKEKDTQINQNETIEPKIENSITGVSALSLKSIQKKRELQATINPIAINHEDLPKDSYTFDQLKTHWDYCSKQYFSTGRMLMSSTMNMANLTLQNDVLLVEFPNEGSKLSFEENLYELVSYIHKKLNNYHLKIEVIVNEKTEIKKAFTIHDKLDYLKKINPVLENLIKTFDLEVKP